MRFPKLSELDQDQTKIYQGAPPDGPVLIVGPPGTGKSVIAFHRAHFLSKLDRSPRVLMFNKVLAKYTEKRGSVAKDVEVSTLHKWAFGWWKRIGGPKSNPPTLDGAYEHDWHLIRDTAIPVAATSVGAKRLGWGHLIIDEGQDFPKAMYGCMKMVMELCNMNGAQPQSAITVLADENQRLTYNRNSTVNDIKHALGLHEMGANVFSLKKNYRNTREIARFAAMFYVGLPTGMPEEPDKPGDLPVVYWVDREDRKKFLNACAQQIARYVKSRPADEIGVLTMSNRDRSSLVNRLRAAFDNTKLVVQTYARQDEDAQAEDLVFDTPGHVTVLNVHSAKGLEFDAVFIIDPGGLVTASGGSSDLYAKMTLYVMCSRARRALNLLIVDDANSKNLLAHIPEQLYESETL